MAIPFSVTGLQWACDHFKANKGDSYGRCEGSLGKIFLFRKMVVAVPFLPFLLVPPSLLA